MSTAETPAGFVGRLKSVLPPRWFADATPVLDGLLSGLGCVWTTIHTQLLAARSQVRLATAEGGFLDLFAADFFGRRFRRLAGQGDGGFRLAVARELVRERATRAGLVGALTDLTGFAPVVFEPSRPADTRAWGLASGYGVAGGWGSLALPFQCLVAARRPPGAGIVQLPGWSSPASGWGVAGGWASLDMVAGQVTDADIRAAALRSMPAGSICWIRISS